MTSVSLISDRRSSGSLSAPTYAIGTLALKPGDEVQIAAAIPPWANVGAADGAFEIALGPYQIAAGTYATVAEIVSATATAAGAPYALSYSDVTRRVTISNGGGANFDVAVAAGDLFAAHLGFAVGALTGANSYTGTTGVRIWPYSAVLVCPEIATLLERPDDGTGGTHLPNSSIWPGNSVLDVPLPSGGTAFTYYGWGAGESLWRRVTAPARLHSLTFSVVDTGGTELSFDDPLVVELRVRRAQGHALGGL